MKKFALILAGVTVVLLVSLLVVLLSAETCTITEAFIGRDTKVCECDGFEILVKNTLPRDGVKVTKCIGTVTEKYGIDQ